MTIRKRGVRIVARGGKRKKPRTKLSKKSGEVFRVTGTRNPSHPDFHPSKAEQNGWRKP